jgi:hypothetical protein
LNRLVNTAENALVAECTDVIGFIARVVHGQVASHWGKGDDRASARLTAAALRVRRAFDIRLFVAVAAIMEMALPRAHARSLSCANTTAAARTHVSGSFPGSFNVIQRALAQSIAI